MYHVSSPNNRQNILKQGLLPTCGPRRCLGNEWLPPTIFLTKEEPFASTYDDDVYWVDIDPDKLHLDEGMKDSYYTLECIDVAKIKLIKQGTGKDLLFE